MQVSDSVRVWTNGVQGHSILLEHEVIKKTDGGYQDMYFEWKLSKTCQIQCNFGGIDDLCNLSN